MTASPEPAFLAARPLLVVRSLLLHDFLHEIGHPIGLLGMMAFGMADGDEQQPVTLSRQRAGRLAAAVDGLAQACEMMRSIGIPLRGAAHPDEQWQIIARRLETVSKLARARPGAALEVVPARCPVALNPALAALEAIAVCIIKEVSDQLPAAAGGRITLRLQHGGDDHLPPALDVALDGTALHLAPALVPAALWVADALGWRVLAAPDGIGLHIRKH